MRIEAKGAFKFGTAGKATIALQKYGGTGYGVLSVSDWRVAGAYAFIDKTLEFDVDMVGWRRAFDELALATQEGEIDLREHDGAAFVRLSRGSDKRKALAENRTEGFGEPLAARASTWGDALVKIEKARAKAEAKAAAELAAAVAASQRLLVSSSMLGGPGRGMIAESDGTVTVLAGGSLSRVGPSGVVESHRVDPEGLTGRFGSFTRLDEGTLVAWAGRDLVVVRADGMKTFALTRARTAPEGLEDADVREVFPSSRPDELLIRERDSVRRLDRVTGKELGEVAFSEGVAYRLETAERPRRAGSLEGSSAAVRVPGGVACAHNDDDSGEVLVLRDDLTEDYRVKLEGRVAALAVSDGALVALVSSSSIAASLVPLTREGAGQSLFRVGNNHGSITPLEAGLIVCASSSLYWMSPTGVLSRSMETAPSVVVPRGDGTVAVATSEDVAVMSPDAAAWGATVRPPLKGIVWRADIGIKLKGPIWVGDDLVGFRASDDATIYRVRRGEQKAQKLLGHSAPVITVVALGGPRFASLAGNGEVRFWDLSRA
jgi:hypothetical protein